MVREMEDFFKAQTELRKQQSLLNNRLKKVLQNNGYDNCFAWFIWKEDEVSIIWDDEKLPKVLLDDLENEFGRMNRIEYSTNPISKKIYIVFEKEMFR